MRTSAVLTAAFAGCAFSSPLLKRDTVLEIDTVYDEVYVTEVITVTAGQSTPTPSVYATTTTEAPEVSSSSTSTSSSSFSAPEQKSFYVNRHSWSSEWSSATTIVATPTAAASSSSTSVYVAPSSTSIYVAPTTSSTSTSVYVAPSSSAPASTSSAAESTTSSAASSLATTYQEKVIAHHNVHRSNHSASALTWSDDLANTAQSIAATCVYAHNTTANGGGYGQNIAAGVDSTNISAVITDLFYNGEVNYFDGLYGEANPDMTNFESWGHFSQIVWKGTTEVGCATYDCSSSGLANTGEYVSPYFTVCNYGPPGNYAGEYADNIGDSLNQATVDWNYDL